MVYPIVYSQSTGHSGNATSHSMTLPAIVTAGQVLFAVVTTDGGTDTTTVASGWTRIATGGPAGMVAAWFEKLTTDGSEGGTSITMTTSASEKIAWVVSAIGTVAASAGNDAGGTADGSVATMGGVSFSKDTIVIGDRLLILSGSWDGAATVSATPSTETLYQQDHVEGTATGVGVAVAMAEWTNDRIGTYTSGTWTLSGATDWTSRIYTYGGGPDGIPTASRVSRRASYPPLLAQ